MANGRFDVVDVAANDNRVTRDIDAGRVAMALLGLGMLALSVLRFRKSMD